MNKSQIDNECTMGGLNHEFFPLVSIIIPVYNGANYLRIAIDSALAQTYKNIEVIVVNDGSCDDGKTDAISQSYGEKIHYFQKLNGGCATALNLGIAKMRGEYFSWLSHDDVYYPEKIAHQISILRNLANKDTIIYGGYELIDQNSKSYSFVRPDRILPEDKLNTPLMPLLRGLIHGCALLIPSKYFHEIGVFDETLLTTQDYELWFAFLRVAPIYFDSKILMQSRTHPDQSTHKIAQGLSECETLWTGILNKLTDDEMMSMEGSRYLFLERTAHFLKHTPYQQSAKLASEMLKEVIKNTQVSVILPFFNRITWTLRAIQSVLDQTHENFELILVDDGSTDEVSEIIAICKKDSRVKYFRKENSGPAAARNYGVNLATSNYIAFLDSDDLFMPNKLEIQIDYMQKNGLNFSHTSYSRIDINENFISQMNTGYFSGNVFPKIIASCPIATPTVMGTRKLFKEYCFPEGFQIGEDHCVWIKISRKNNVGVIDKDLSSVRILSSSSAIDYTKQVIGYLNVATYILQDPELQDQSYFVKNMLNIAIQLIKIDETCVDKPSIVGEFCKYIIKYSVLTSFYFGIVIRSIKYNGFRNTIEKIIRRFSVIK